MPRLASVLLPLLFLFTAAGNGFGHQGCEHHGVAPSGHAESGHEAGHPAGHGEESGAQCTCVGVCEAAGAATALPTAAVEQVPIVPISSPSPSGGRDEHPHNRRVPYLLPYGLAPPVSR